MPKRPYKRKLNANEQLLADAHEAMNDVIQEWENSDSPEGFCYAMKALMIHRDRIAARLNLPQPTATDR